MAQISFNEEQNPMIQNEPIKVEQSNIEQPIEISVEQEEKIFTADDITKGLTREEINDPNQISVTISDKDAPIVVLFGPPQCGKTMTLVRLTRFLSENGYTITPVRTFRPTYDSNYTDLCDNFDTMINQDNAADSTNRISFMLVKVSKKGRPICQLLEAPGEYYFNPKAPNTPFPRYFNAIKSSKNRKIWTIMVEPDWANEEDRKNYVTRIKYLKKQMATKDKTIVVYNKIDKTDFLIDNSGNAQIGAAIKNIKDLYPGIFVPFKNTQPIVSWFKPYNCDFTVFQTGDYTKTDDNTIVFQQGADVFPRRLWSIIIKHVRG